MKKHNKISDFKKILILDILIWLTIFLVLLISSRGMWKISGIVTLIMIIIMVTFQGILLGVGYLLQPPNIKYTIQDRKKYLNPVWDRLTLDVLLGLVLIISFLSGKYGWVISVLLTWIIIKGISHLSSKNPSAYLLFRKIVLIISIIGFFIMFILIFAILGRIFAE